MTRVDILLSTNTQKINSLVKHITYLHNRIDELQDEQDKLIFDLGNLDDNACELLLYRLSNSEKTTRNKLWNYH